MFLSPLRSFSPPSLSLSPQSLMSTTAFGLGSKYFALYEVSGVGIQWHTFSQSPVEGDDFNLLLSMMMLIIDAVVYGVLTWYIEAVHPGMGLGEPREGLAHCSCYHPGLRPSREGSCYANRCFSPRDVRAPSALVLSAAEVLLAGKRAHRGLGLVVALVKEDPSECHRGRPSLCHGEQEDG